MRLAGGQGKRLEFPNRVSERGNVQYCVLSITIVCGCWTAGCLLCSWNRWLDILASRGQESYAVKSKSHRKA